MRTIDFKGTSVQYEEKCVMSYRWQKALNSGDEARGLKAIERLFCGRDEYYAYAIGTADPMTYEDWLAAGDDVFLDGSMDGMGELLQAVMEDMGQTAKN